MAYSAVGTRYQSKSKIINNAIKYMKHKKSIFWAGLMGVIALPILAVEKQQPNVIVLFIDDLGYNDLGYRNSSFETPHIDRLASESIDFVNAYVPSPTSSPSRVGLLTGRHPLKVGFTRHIEENAYDPYKNEEFGLNADDPGEKPSRQYLPLKEVTFAEALKSLGYKTCAIGKWHLGKEPYYPQMQGFDDVYGESSLGNPVCYFPPYFKKAEKQTTEGEYLTDYLTDHAVEVIKTNDYKKAPLCMYLAHYGVHSPHQAPSEVVEKYMKRGIEKNYATYHAMVEAIDNSVGLIIDAIKQAGVADNTVLMFISDQGGYFTNYPLKGGKQAGTALYEGGAKIPFIVKLPNTEKGRIVEERINTLDVFPTLVELAGGDMKEYPQLEGLSLVSTFAGGHCHERPLYFYRSYDDQASSIILKGYKFIYTRSGNHELYNLNVDPNEATNLINDARVQDIKAKLKMMVEDFLKKYDLPSIPYPTLPPHAYLNQATDTKIKLETVSAER